MSTKQTRDISSLEISPLRPAGTRSTQDVTLQNSTTESIKHLTVTDLQVISRTPRQTITVFDVDHKKQN